MAEEGVGGAGEAGEGPRASAAPGGSVAGQGEVGELGVTGETGEKKEEQEKKHTYALVQFSDMPDEIQGEAVELATTAIEKFSHNNESAARMIKEHMDKNYGPSWHVVVGEGYGFEISYETKNILYMYFGGNVAICVWKCC